MQGKQYHFPTAHLDSRAQTIGRRNGPWPLSSGPDAISHHMLVLACSALRELARLPVSRTPIKTRAPLSFGKHGGGELSASVGQARLLAPIGK